MNTDADGAIILRPSLIRKPNKLSHQVEHNSGQLRNKRKDYKVKLIAQRGNACETCGVKYNSEPGFGNFGHFSFDFHHINPQLKSFEITKTLRNTKTLLFELELAKCIMVCKQCHHQIEYNKQKIPEHLIANSEIMIEKILEEIKERSAV